MTISPSLDECKEYVRLKIEPDYSECASIADGCRKRLDDLLRVVESAAHAGLVDHFRERITALIPRVEAWQEENNTGFETDIWNAISGLSHEIRTYGPHPLDEWDGIEQLWNEYDALPVSEESIRKKLKLMGMACSTTAVRDGAQKHSRLLLGLEKRRIMFGGTPTMRDIHAEMEAVANAITSDANEENLEACNVRLNSTWQDLMPHRGMT